MKKTLFILFLLLIPIIAFPESDVSPGFAIGDEGFIDYFPGEYWTTNHKTTGRDRSFYANTECWGFARYVQHLLYDSKIQRIYIDILPYGKRDYNADDQLKPQPEEVQQQIKDILLDAGPGAHVRVFNANGKDQEYVTVIEDGVETEKLSYGHSFIILSVSEESLSIIQCNAKYGDFEKPEHNLISTATWTWDTFFNEIPYGMRGIRFIEVPIKE